MQLHAFGQDSGTALKVLLLVPSCGARKRRLSGLSFWVLDNGQSLTKSVWTAFSDSERSVQQELGRETLCSVSCPTNFAQASPLHVNLTLPSQLVRMR